MLSNYSSSYVEPADVGSISPDEIELIRAYAQ
jgi:hypothetical protein